jgi:hypothetical protein
VDSFLYFLIGEARNLFLYRFKNLAIDIDLSIIYVVEEALKYVL